MSTCAVIDVGTNTLILLIARVKGKQIEVLHDEAVVTRLGQGLTENHFFLSDAMKRSRETICAFKKTCDAKKVKKIYAVGTAACRIAANTQVFIDSVKEACGIVIKVITGDEEAELSFKAVLKDFSQKDKKIIAVDIGGGSTEIITGPVNAKKLSPETAISLPLGSVRLTEQFVTNDPIPEEQFKRLHTSIRNDLADELDDFYSEPIDPKKYVLVATAGTATTLAALDRKVKKYDPTKIHGKPLKQANLEAIIQQLIPLKVQDRQKLPGMEPLRADVILAGALLLLEILKFFKKDEAIISDRGLRYGVFYKKFL